MEVIRHAELTVSRIANSFKSSNTFIIAPDDTDKVWIVDIGDASAVLSAIGDRVIAGIFLTHAHLDHIYGIKEIRSAFPYCKVYGSERCIAFLSDDRKNLSLFYERPLSLRLDNCHALPDGSAVQLSGGLRMECFHTPGHSADSVCYQLADLLFTGDAFIPGIATVTKLRGGSKQLAARSTELILARVNPTTVILPGHGAVRDGL